MNNKGPVPSGRAWRVPITIKVTPELARWLEAQCLANQRTRSLEAATMLQERMESIPKMCSCGADATLRYQGWALMPGTPICPRCNAHAENEEHLQDRLQGGIPEEPD